MAMMQALSAAYGPAIIAGRSHHRPSRSQRVPLPRRGGYTLMFVEDGQVRLETTAARHRFGPGSVALLDSRVAGTLTGPPGAHWHRVHFDVIHRERIKRGRAWVPRDPSQVQPSALAVWNVELPIRLPGPLQTRARRAAQRIADQWWRSNLDLLAANATLTGLLADCVTRLRERWSPEQSAPTANAGDEPDWLIEAEALARQLAQTGCSVADLADHVGLRREHFTARYRALRGEPPGAFLRRLRLDAGRAALDAGATVADAAAAAGYRSSAAFTTAFTAATGSPPDTWRRRG